MFIQPFRRLAILLLVNLCAIPVLSVGCQNGEPQNQKSTEPIDVELEYAFAELGRRSTPEAYRNTAFERIQASAPLENPNVWCPILMNSSAGPEERCAYVCEFFRRHVRKGTRITTIQGMDALKIASRDEVLWHDITNASNLGPGIDRERAELVLKFQADFMRPLECAIFLEFRQAKLFGKPVVYTPRTRTAP